MTPPGQRAHVRGVSDELVTTVTLERGRLLHRSGREREAVASLEGRSPARAQPEARTSSSRSSTSWATRGATSMCPARSVCSRTLCAREPARGRARPGPRTQPGVFVHSDALRLDRASQDGERALALALRTGDERIVAEALDALKLVAWQLGDVERLSELTTRLERSNAALASSGRCAGRSWRPRRLRSRGSGGMTRAVG